MPLRYRHGYAAGFHRDLPAGDINRRGSCRHASCAGAHRLPAQIRQVRAGGSLEERLTLVPCVHLPISLAGPEPSDGAGPSRLCQGRLPPSPASPGIRLPSATSARCDGLKAVSFHHRMVQQRLVALQVRHPQQVRTVNHEMALYQILGGLGLGILPGGVNPLAPAHTLQTGFPHQPCHPLVVDGMTTPFQRRDPARDSIGPARMLMDGSNHRLQRRIGLSPSAGWSTTPRLVAAGGDTQYTAQGGDGILILVCAHELEMSYCQIWCIGMASSSGVPADFTLIDSVDELYPGNNISQLPEPPEPTPALLGTHGQLVHQRQAGLNAVAVARLDRSQSKGGEGRLDRVGGSQVLPMRGWEVIES